MRISFTFLNGLGGVKTNVSIQFDTKFSAMNAIKSSTQQSGLLCFVKCFFQPSIDLLSTCYDLNNNFIFIIAQKGMFSFPFSLFFSFYHFYFMKNDFISFYAATTTDASFSPIPGHVFDRIKAKAAQNGKFISFQ